MHSGRSNTTCHTETVCMMSQAVRYHSRTWPIGGLVDQTFHLGFI